MVTAQAWLSAWVSALVQFQDVVTVAIFLVVGLSVVRFVIHRVRNAMYSGGDEY